MSDKIKCPNCGHIFDVEEALSGKLEAQFKAEFEKKIAEQATKFNVEKKKLDSEKEQFQLQKEQQDDLIKVAIKKQWEQQKASIEKSAKESSEEQIKALQEENEKRRAENKTLRQKEVNLLKKESELKEKQEDLQLEMEKQLLDRQKEIEDKARSNERESFELEKAQLLKQIEENISQLAILNDEIRNPLTVIVGVVDMDMENLTSSKAIKAKELGIRIISREEFDDKFQ